MSDNGFGKACPNGNTLIDGFKQEPKICYRCVGTKRVWASEDDIFEMIFCDGQENGLDWVIDIILGFQGDNCRPCPECGGA